MGYREFQLSLLENTARPNSSDMSQQTESEHSFLGQKKKREREKRLAFPVGIRYDIDLKIFSMKIFMLSILTGT